MEAEKVYLAIGWIRDLRQTESEIWESVSKDIQAEPGLKYPHEERMDIYDTILDALAQYKWRQEP